MWYLHISLRITIQTHLYNVYVEQVCPDIPFWNNFTYQTSERKSFHLLYFDPNVKNSRLKSTMISYSYINGIWTKLCFVFFNLNEVHMYISIYPYKACNIFLYIKFITFIEKDQPRPFSFKISLNDDRLFTLFYRILTYF